MSIHLDERNWKNCSHLIGYTGKGTILQLWAVVSNTDLNDSSFGDDIDISYHETEESARKAAKGKGCMGSTAEVAPRLAIQFTDGKLMLLAHFVVPDRATAGKTLPVISLVAEPKKKSRQKAG